MKSSIAKKGGTRNGKLYIGSECSATNFTDNVTWSLSKKNKYVG